MSMLSIKQSITSFFIMPRGSSYIVRVRHYHRRPPGSFRRRHVGARYPGGHILNRSDLASYISLLSQNGFLPSPGPGPGVHLQSVLVEIPGLSNKTVSSSNSGLFPFPIPPVPEGTLASRLDKVVVSPFNAAWTGSSDGYFGIVVHLTSPGDCCGMRLKRTTASVPSCTRNLYVWLDDNHVCCGYVCASLSDVLLFVMLFRRVIFLMFNI
jgi:hypothetical protein